MIRLDPFYFLLLLEFLLIQLAIIIILFLKGRKLKDSYLKSVKIIRDFNWQHDNQGDQELNRTGVSNPEPQAPLLPEGETWNQGFEGGDNGEIKRLQDTLQEKVEIILQMKNKIEQMEKKFMDMEKEYLILFDQSQKQEEALKKYEGGQPKLDEIDF